MRLGGSSGRRLRVRVTYGMPARKYQVKKWHEMATKTRLKTVSRQSESRPTVVVVDRP